MNNTERQEVDRLMALAEKPSSNSNKYRHALYAHIEKMIEDAYKRGYITKGLEEFENGL